MQRELFTLSDEARRMLDLAFAKPVIQYSPMTAFVKASAPASQITTDFAPEAAPSA